MCLPVEWGEGDSACLYRGRKLASEEPGNFSLPFSRRRRRERGGKHLPGTRSIVRWTCILRGGDEVCLDPQRRGWSQFPPAPPGRCTFFFLPLSEAVLGGPRRPGPPAL